MPKLMTCSRPAPTAATPSDLSGVRGLDASRSAACRARRRYGVPRASVPAKGPRPTAVTNMRANTNSLTARRTSMSRRATRGRSPGGAAVPRAQEAERDGDHDGENGAPERDAHRHDALPGVLADVRRRTGAGSRCRKTAMLPASRRSSSGRSSTTRAARPSATTRSEPRTAGSGRLGSASGGGTGAGPRSTAREGVGHGSRPRGLAARLERRSGSASSGDGPEDLVERGRVERRRAARRRRGGPAAEAEHAVGVAARRRRPGAGWRSTVSPVSAATLPERAP